MFSKFSIADDLWDLARCGTWEVLNLFVIQINFKLTKTLLLY